jgi:predicted N-acetyltransferase YhbS
MEIRGMGANDREAVLGLLERAFGERELFARYMDRDPAFSYGDFLLALDAGRPVSCVQVFEKTIRLRGQGVALGGIGSVATDPEYRKRGLAYELLRRSEERMRERGMVLGLLFAVLWDFYGALGWVQIPMRQVVLHRGSGSGAPLDIALRDFSASDLPAVAALYDTFTRELDGPVVRDETYWRGQLQCAGNPDELFKLAFRGDELVAYARRVDLTTPVLMEHAHAPGAEAVLAHLIAELCPPDKGVVLRLHDAELERELARRCASVDRVDDPTLMWRVLDAPALAAVAGLPADTPGRELLRALIEEAGAQYFVSDRF